MTELELVSDALLTAAKQYNGNAFLTVGNRFAEVEANGKGDLLLHIRDFITQGQSLESANPLKTIQCTCYVGFSAIQGQSGEEDWALVAQAEAIAFKAALAINRVYTSGQLAALTITPVFYAQDAGFNDRVGVKMLFTLTTKIPRC
ncbi:MAG: hypothetical protein EBX40_03090 [Gammaproteobacteria bacterium]|nr:hypothetical protein [Gammaproteobacteria bacterium]